MRIPLLRLLTAITLGVGSTAGAAADQCLSKAELMDVARMGTVMGLGGALKRCGNCLGDRYQKTVESYETSGLHRLRENGRHGRRARLRRRTIQALRRRSREDHPVAGIQALPVGAPPAR